MTSSRCIRKFGFGSDGWSFPNATIPVWDLAARRRQGIRASTIAQCAIVQLYNIQCSHISQCAMWLYDMNRTSPPPMPPYGSDLRAITYLAYMWCTQIQYSRGVIAWFPGTILHCKFASLPNARIRIRSCYHLCRRTTYESFHISGSDLLAPTTASHS